MARYEITSPDGQKYEITAPDNAPEADVMAYAQQQFSGVTPKLDPPPAPAPVQPRKEESFGQALGSELKGFYTGLHRIPQSVIELGLRGTDAAGLTNGAYPAAHQMFKDDNAQFMGDSRAARVGDIAGQVAATLPLAAARLPQLGNAAVRAGARIAEGGFQGAGAAALTSSAGDTPLGEQVGLGALAGSAIPVAGAAVRGANNLLPKALSLSTGAGTNSIQQAYRAGKAGGDAGRAFIGNMRGQVPMELVVADAKAALGNMRAERGAAYRAGMADISRDRSVLDFAPIDAAMAKASSVKTFKGVDLSPKTAGVRQEIDAAINNWKALDPAEYHTPEGFDALKQQIGDIRDALPFGSPERTVADNAYSAVRKSIAEQAPAYNKVMADYTKASELMGEIEGALSLGNRAKADTALRKLQSVMRDNVNTNWGNRVDYAKALSEAGADTLLPSLAGQALSSPLPRGLARYGDIGLGLAALSHNPAALAALPLASPRVVGELAYGAGAANRGATGLLDHLPITISPKLPVLNPLLGFAVPATAAR